MMNTGSFMVAADASPLSPVNDPVPVPAVVLITAVGVAGLGTTAKLRDADTPPPPPSVGLNTVMGKVPTVKKSKKGTAALRRFGLKKDVVRSVPLKRTTAPGTKLAPFTKTVNVPLERLPCIAPAGDNRLSVGRGLAEGAAS